ncbi:hypothetical protein AC739_18060 [Planococcus glaciei]|uniref:DUF2294 domain-containing protein n=1 Tax=Planococcus glaciei TaxID=459472 RepID=UPI00069D308C|nr:Na-translocating system protein MpsC family protein [Planococcus glaciei]KOF08834.1 hypothetical protein AC739_18060 [Planococcus glaciei]
MPEEKTTSSEISGYMSNLLRKHFGKGPTSVYVTIKRPYIAIHFRGFLSPMEAILLKQNEWKRVLETRDLLMNDLKPQIQEHLLKIAGMDFAELYADWNLPMKSGLILGIMDEKATADTLRWPAGLDRKTFHQKIEQVNKAVEREPGSIESVWLSNRTLLVKCSEIMVGIENALIAEGYSEVLKLVKRPLERSMLYQVKLEETLHREVNEIFMDWNFEQDVGYLIFQLSPD